MKQKKEFLSEGLKKMQRLAGIIIENTEVEKESIVEGKTPTQSDDNQPETKFEKRSNKLFENIDRMKKLSGLSKDEE
jgi:hypothetical protein